MRRGGAGRPCAAPLSGPAAGLSHPGATPAQACRRSYHTQRELICGYATAARQR